MLLAVWSTNYSMTALIFVSYLNDVDNSPSTNQVQNSSKIAKLDKIWKKKWVQENTIERVNIHNYFVSATEPTLLYNHKCYIAFILK